jgi:hypothetical protein
LKAPLLLYLEYEELYYLLGCLRKAGLDLWEEHKIRKEITKLYKKLQKEVKRQLNLEFPKDVKTR